jgi:glycosyltransferase involved in cell wall biosynthesis
MTPPSGETKVTPSMAEDELRITLLTEYFHPEEASTAQLLTELATGLTSQFDVSVVTGYPSYHDDDRETTVPKHSTYEGVEVRRVRGTRLDKDSLMRRVVNWVTFTALAFVRLLLDAGERDAVVVLSNPPILPFAALLNRLLRGTPYVYVVYDVYPDMPVALGLLDDGSPVVRVWDRLMRPVYRNADAVVVLGDSMEQHLREKLDDDDRFDPDDIEVIQNWEDESFIRPTAKEDNAFAREQGTTERFTLLYSGNIGRFHELETAIDAVGLLEDRGRTDIGMLVIGEGARKAELRDYVEAEGIENVDFLPFQPRERLPETLTAGDASLVGIKPEMEGMCVSSKLYSSLAAGVPILAVVGEGDEVARVVQEFDCGAYVPPGDAEAAADALAKWADDELLAERQGDNARETFVERYTKDRAITQYGDLLKRVTGDH